MIQRHFRPESCIWYRDLSFPWESCLKGQGSFEERIDFWWVEILVLIPQNRWCFHPILKEKENAGIGYLTYIHMAGFSVLHPLLLQMWSHLQGKWKYHNGVSPCTFLVICQFLWIFPTAPHKELFEGFFFCILKWCDAVATIRFLALWWNSCCVGLMKGKWYWYRWDPWIHITPHAVQCTGLCRYQKLCTEVDLAKSLWTTIRERHHVDLPTSPQVLHFDVKGGKNHVEAAVLPRGKALAIFTNDGLVLLSVEPSCQRLPTTFCGGVTKMWRHGESLQWVVHKHKRPRGCGVWVGGNCLPAVYPVQAAKWWDSHVVRVKLVEDRIPARWPQNALCIHRREAGQSFLTRRVDNTKLDY